MRPSAPAARNQRSSTAVMAVGLGLKLQSEGRSVSKPELVRQMLTGVAVVTPEGGEATLK